MTKARIAFWKEASRKIGLQNQASAEQAGLGPRCAVRNRLRPGGSPSGEEFKPAHGRRVPTRVVAVHLRRQERQELGHGLIGHGALHFAAGLAVRPTETERAAISKRERRAVPEMLEVKGWSAGNATRYQP